MLTSPLSIAFDLLFGAFQVCLGILVENAGEWAFHRYVLHGLGKRRNSLWGYHWHEHHRVASANGMLDPGYQGWPVHWNTQGKEVLFLFGVVLIHLPLLAIVPGYVAGLYGGLAVYYLRHRRAHLDREWAKSHLPWHYEHHMGQADANWCVAWPWFDIVMGTHVRPDANGE